MAAPRRLPTWYEGGIRFECQATGRCCWNHGEYAYVYVTAADEARLAAHLGLEIRALRRRYTTRVEGRRVLRSRDDRCVFLEQGLCAVHAAKPVQCATWPFWRDNLDPAVWEKEIAPFCAGVGKGRLWSREEIEEMAARHEEE